MKDGSTPFPSNADTDERTRRMELVISNLLRAGVLLSLVLVAVGTVVSYIHHPEYVSSPGELPQIIQAGASFPHTLQDVFTGVWNLQGRAIVMVGLLLLIATPVMRVAVSVLAFIYQKDRVYTLITFLVLCLLFLSFILGKTE